MANQMLHSKHPYMYRGNKGKGNMKSKKAVVINNFPIYSKGTKNRSHTEMGLLNS